MGKRKGRPAGKSRGGRGGAVAGSEPRPASEPEVEETEEEAEGESDFCFACKDGGDLHLCDYRNCHKGYHSYCAGKDEEFLKSDQEFICRWHTCFICQGRSYFRCLCCPDHSVCRGCLRQAEFAQVGKQTKGFCTNCLRTAIMIEKNVEVDSDGEKVDFSDKSTIEFLFKDYWEIIKKKEGLTLDNLLEGHASLDNSPNCNHMSDSENFPKEHCSDDDFLGNIDDGDDEPVHLSNVNGSSNKVKGLRKQGKSKKNVYVGWGSKELIEFLVTIGKDASKSLDQFGAAEVVREYIRQKDLSRKDKKKYVRCDGKLLPLFRKKEIKFTKIYSLLERHIAANATSEVETLSSSEDKSDSIRKKRSRTMISEPSISKGISERYRRCFASLVLDNIKLIYLRRSLVMDLLKQPEAFESKVIGCFVRVKNDPKYCTYNRPKTGYQLGQVTGIGKSSEEYKIRDISTNMLLRISSCWSEVNISVLSDEDFGEDECEDLRVLVKKEQSKRHTVAELEEKARNVHRDIVSHWIDKELQRLEKYIERANEKGWRPEMHECIEKRRLLRTPSERQRLLEEAPRVIPDLEDTEDPELLVAASDKSFQIATAVLQGASGEGAVCLESCSQEISKGASEERAPCLKSCSEDKSKGANEKAVCLKSCSEEKSEGATEQTVFCKSWSEENPKAIEADACTPGMCVQNQAIAVKCNAAGDTPRTYASNQGTEVKCNAAGDTPRTYASNQGTEVKCNAAGDTTRTYAPNQGTEVKCNAAGDTTRTYAPNQGTEGSEDNAAGDRVEMHVQKKSTEGNAAGIAAEIIIIDDDDDDDTTHDDGANTSVVDLDAGKSRDTRMVSHETCRTAMWYYLDPQDHEQGPFAMELLRGWKEASYFDDDFRVWRAGQSIDSAILLTDALRLER